MARDDDHLALNSFVRALFRRKARQIIGKAGVTAADVEDVVQDLYVRFLGRLPQFDGSNLHAFATLVAKQAVTDHLRRLQADKRAARGTASLGTPVVGPDGSAATLADAVTQDHLDAGRGVSRGDAVKVADLALDLAEVLAHLPPRQQQDLAERLLAGDSVSAIARDLGVPRTTVSSWVRRLRECFEQAGLRAYP